jgi:hypothetical protein
MARRPARVCWPYVLVRLLPGGHLARILYFEAPPDEESLLRGLFHYLLAQEPVLAEFVAEVEGTTR